MDKPQLQAILSTKYQPAFWRQVLTDVFGATNLFQQPLPVPLPVNELAESSVELGSFETSDGRLVGLYQIDLKPTVRIGQNRVGLRSLLRSIYKYDVDAALVVFVQDEKWRLSLISEIRVLDGDGNVSEQKTEPKRFTFLLGDGEAVRTARDRLFALAGSHFNLETLIDKFSVEKLTKDFFRRYKELFGLFCEHLAESSDYRRLFLGSAARPKDGWKDPLAKPIRDFTKILLGRLVFLQFLQKKGWMGVPAGEATWENGDVQYLKHLFERIDNKENFHSGALRTLFFETLNRKRKADVAASELGENIRIPYLNGGLFDTDISTGNVVDFPKQLFADLLDFFEQYNFTIDEDDPYDREVGIDPEMLGHIFENLLEENREKGAFYTPKEIVHYMCQESLIEYLATQLPEVDRPAIEMLVRDNQVSKDFTNLAKATEIDRLLRDVKICDPAIGSGAFPMGLLKEIFECRRLVYPYLKTNEAFDPARIKKEIIQNNIYGVDIDNGAVEIARLRFWLALVVDEIEPAPLPNLDYKIMQGNSLLERFEDIDLSNLVSADSDDGVMVSEQLAFDEGLAFPVQMTVFDQATKETLYELITKYFDTDEWEERNGEHLDKASIKRQINDIVEGKIHAHILQEKLELESEISKYDLKLRLAKDGKIHKDTKDYRRYLRQKERFARFDETEAKLIALQHSESKPYFLWHLWFKDVFDRGGFDIVIGNPPYISHDKIIGKDEIKLIYKTYEPFADIYCYFIELAGNLSAKNRITCLITSNSFFRADYGRPLRNLISTDSSLLRLINLEQSQLFESAIVNVAILLFRKGLRSGASCIVSNSKYDLSEALVDFVKKNQIVCSQEEFTSGTWSLSRPDVNRLRRKIEGKGTSLEKIGAKIRLGLATGDNNVFIIDNEKRTELIRKDPRNGELIKPVIRGRNIHRYSYDEPDRYILLTKNGINVERDFPVLYEYFSSFGSSFRNRGARGQHWTNLRACAFFDDFQKEKIVWIELTDVGRFALCNEEVYLLNTAYFLLPPTIFDSRYLLGVLNSNTIKFYLGQIADTSGMGVTRWINNHVKEFPVVVGRKDVQIEITNCVAELLAAKKSNPGTVTHEIEREIDELVYKLYDLTEDEIAIIEGRA